jgi:hypothetical protein
MFLFFMINQKRMSIANLLVPNRYDVKVGTITGRAGEAPDLGAQLSNGSATAVPAAPSSAVAPWNLTMLNSPWTETLQPCFEVGGSGENIICTVPGSYEIQISDVFTYASGTAGAVAVFMEILLNGQLRSRTPVEFDTSAIVSCGGSTRAVRELAVGDVITYNRFYSGSTQVINGGSTLQEVVIRKLST